MKKIIAVLAAMAVTSISAFALDITVGARGNYDMFIGTTLEGGTAEYVAGQETTARLAGQSWKEGPNMVGYGFAVYGNFGFLNLGAGTLGAQVEAGMNFNNGYTVEFGDKADNRSDMTIDIPVLVTFTFPVSDAFSIGAGVGPYLSIPLGYDEVVKADNYKASSWANIKANMNFGLAFDANGAFKAGPGSIVLDLRYLMDFGPTKLNGTDKTTGVRVWNDEETFTRRGLLIGLGYQITF